MRMNAKQREALRTVYQQSSFCKQGGPYEVFRAMIAWELSGAIRTTTRGDRFYISRDGSIHELHQEAQGTRLLRCECPQCGYLVRTTAIWLETGPPHCPRHGAMNVG